MQFKGNTFCLRLKNQTATVDTAFAVELGVKTSGWMRLAQCSTIFQCANASHRSQSQNWLKIHVPRSDIHIFTTFFLDFIYSYFSVFDVKRSNKYNCLSAIWRWQWRHDVLCMYSMLVPDEEVAYIPNGYYCVIFVCIQFDSKYTCRSLCCT